MLRMMSGGRRGRQRSSLHAQHYITNHRITVAKYRARRYSRAMNAAPSLLTAVRQLSDADRFEIAMTILDHASPSAMNEGEILAEAAWRQDELESGAVAAIGFDELVRGLSHCRHTSLLCLAHQQVSPNTRALP